MLELGEELKLMEQFRELHVKQPQLVKDYNHYLGGVNKSDQLINEYKF